ncbi:MAG: mechanosensitive ion channel [Saprospiraceae bacterium]|nr:mechanosensitive ion channel [Saprospiraceae bacterium]
MYHLNFLIIKLSILLKFFNQLHIGFGETLQIWNKLTEIGLFLLEITIIYYLIKFINRTFLNLSNYAVQKIHASLVKYEIKKIKIFSALQIEDIIRNFINLVKYALIVFIIYLGLPVVFSIFPETKPFAITMFNWVLNPAIAIFNNILNFLPDLFTIIVVYIITRFIIKIIRFISTEIEEGDIVIPGFHADWAIPTFNIVRFLLYAFMLVIIFPYLPGSSSPAFQGVSIFLGLLLSFGSSSSINNVIAGLVITYMRPFKIGDEVKIGEIEGSVTEKTLLVTRIKTNKNEDVTIPNATILSSNTINYSTHAKDKGLIIHTTLTFDYDLPWQQIHEAMLDAADKTKSLLKEPKPFVLQTALNSFFVNYQLNAYSNTAIDLEFLMSEIHENLQESFKQRNIPMTLPLFKALKEGNVINIPIQFNSKS